MNLTETLFKVKLTEDIQFAKCGKKLVKNTAKKKMANGGDFTDKRSSTNSETSFRKNPTLVTNTTPTADKIPSVIKNTDVRTIKKYDARLYNPQGNLKDVNTNLKDSVNVPLKDFKANKARLDSLNRK